VFQVLGFGSRVERSWWFSQEGIVKPKKMVEAGEKKKTLGKAGKSWQMAGDRLLNLVQLSYDRGTSVIISLSLSLSVHVCGDVRVYMNDLSPPEAGPSVLAAETSSKYAISYRGT